MDLAKIRELAAEKGHFKKPDPIHASKSTIYDFAEKCAAHLKFKVGGDMEELIDSFGGKIHIVDFEDWDSLADGSIFIHKKNEFDVMLPRHTGPFRDRFTLAHEFAHYVLHSNNYAEPLYAARQGSGRLEWEANWFAAGFLMPQKRFAKELERVGPNPFELAARFKVSLAAAKIRLKDFGYE